MRKRTWILAFVACCGFSTTAIAYDAFKEPMQKRYGLKSVACRTCHPDNKDRSIRNKFGDYYAEALKGHDMTKKFNEATDKGEQAQKEYEKEMAKIFSEAMKVVEKKSITIEDLINQGLLNGTRLDTKKSAASAADEQKDEDS